MFKGKHYCQGLGCYLQLFYQLINRIMQAIVISELLII